MSMLNSCTALYKGVGMLGQFMGAVYCMTTGGDDTTKITNKLEELLEAIENQDSSAIMALFSESSKEHIEEFEASTEELINYYSGVHQSIALAGGSVSHSRDEKTGEQRSIRNAFEVTTSECVYRMSLAFTEKDTANSGNVGITSFYIIKKEDDINLFADYGGDGERTPGINIGIQNTWPDHVSYFEDDEEDDDYYE